MRGFSRYLVTVLAVTVVFAACGDSFDPITELPRELSVSEGRLVDADNKLAFKLFREINAREQSENVFISPLSVGMALGMTYNGAAGSTREAMEEVLELQDLTIDEVNQSYHSLIDLLRGLDPQVEFLLANSIWYRNSLAFEQTFLDINRQYFDAEVTGLDFSSPSAAGTINSWVDENTSGRIEEIVDDPIDPAVVMYLINAIYFKADWTYQFDRDLTQDDTFFLADGSEKTVGMMSHEDEIPVFIYYDWDSDLVVVDLAYGGQAYSMTIVLPATPQGADSIAENLTQTRWDGWITALDSTSIELFLPRFRLEYELELKEVLSALGMSVAFDDINADFTNMYAPGGLFLSKVKHKTFVEVTEEGTEAAAATAVEVSLRSAGPSRIVVDRPFLFAIRENHSGTILFMGKIANPIWN